MINHSRQAIQKYIKANNSVDNVTETAYKGHVNRAIVKGEETGIFSRPKGECCTFPLCDHDVYIESTRSIMNASFDEPLMYPVITILTILPGASGTVKLAKKEAKEPAAAPVKKVEPKAEKKAAAPKAKKATTTVRLSRVAIVVSPTDSHARRRRPLQPRRLLLPRRPRRRLCPRLLLPSQRPTQAGLARRPLLLPLLKKRSRVFSAKPNLDV
jgi:hypothetical protein